MADWAADSKMGKENGETSSLNSDKVNGQSRNITRKNSTGSEKSATDSEKVMLAGGHLLSEESITESTTHNGIKANGAGLRIPPRQPSGPVKMKNPKVVTTVTGVSESIPEEDIIIPNDGCIFSFTADNMATFFRYLKIEDRIVHHMHRKGLDGQRFSKLKDSDLESIGIKNPIVVYFRDRSKKKKLPFIL